MSARRHDLSRWQRATLVVIGTGKHLDQLRHELRQMPEPLEAVLDALIGMGLVAPASGLTAASARPAERDIEKETRRYLAYLIGIVENADAATALALTIRLKQATSPDAMQALHPVFLASLSAICGTAEAQRLLAKLAIAGQGARFSSLR